MKFILFRLRNFFDFIWFGVKIGNINLFALAVDFAILIYTILDWESIIATNHLLILFFLIFTNVIWQIYSTLKECYDYYKRKDCFITKVGVSKKYSFDKSLAEHYSLLKIEGTDMSALVSRQINGVLRDSTVTCRLTLSKERRVRKYIRTYKDLLLKFLNSKWHSMSDKGGAFYNESKLCMASELYENESPDGSFSLALCKGNYYISYLTNNIYSMCLNESGFIVEAPRTVRNYPIKPFSESEFGDHIGVSTIIVSSDGYAFLMRHNNRTALSTDELLPSASGSADYSDYSKGDDLKAVITKAVERELKEETGLGKEIIGSTVVTGFYRCLYRGGKPEFCCMTTLKLPKIDVLEIIRPDTKEMSDEIHPVKLPKDGQDFSLLTEFIREHLKECSLPLVMTYYMLLSYFGQEPGIGQECPLQ